MGLIVQGISKMNFTHVSNEVYFGYLNRYKATLRIDFRNTRIPN